MKTIFAVYDSGTYSIAWAARQQNTQDGLKHFRNDSIWHFCSLWTEFLYCPFDDFRFFSSYKASICILQEVVGLIFFWKVLSSLFHSFFRSSDGNSCFIILFAVKKARSPFMMILRGTMLEEFGQLGYALKKSVELQTRVSKNYGDLNLNQQLNCSLLN